MFIYKYINVYIKSSSSTAPAEELVDVLVRVTDWEKVDVRPSDDPREHETGQAGLQDIRLLQPPPNVKPPVRQARLRRQSTTKQLVVQ